MSKFYERVSRTKAKYLASLEATKKAAEKIAEKLTYEEKQELPTPVFAAVYRDKNGNLVKKYPLTDPEHVRAAIAYWNRFKNNLPPSVRTEAARKMVEAAQRFGIEVKDPDILRYAGLTAKKGEAAVDYVLQRARLMANKRAAGEYLKIAEALNENKIDPRVAATKVFELDVANQIDQFYGKFFPDPVESIIKSELPKIGEVMIDGNKITTDIALKAVEMIKPSIAPEDADALTDLIMREGVFDLADKVPEDILTKFKEAVMQLEQSEKPEQ